MAFVGGGWCFGGGQRAVGARIDRLCCDRESGSRVGGWVSSRASDPWQSKRSSCVVRRCFPPTLGGTEGEEAQDLGDLPIPEEEDEVVEDTDAIAIKRQAVLLENDTAVVSELPSMETSRVEVEIGGKTISFETGMVARQAGGAVIVRCEETLMLCTACVEGEAAASADFLPLRVDFTEKFSAIGKTVGTYLKREGRPSEREILVSRLIDRPLRPMFMDGFYNEIQVLSTVLSYDGSVPSDALAICGSAAAIHISSIPLVQAVAGVRIAYIDGEFIVNPSKEQQAESLTDIVVAGTANAILMIEGLCNYLTDEQVLEALTLAQANIKKLCGAMDELRAKAGKEKKAGTVREVTKELLAQVESLAFGLEDAVKVLGKKERDQAVGVIKARVFEELGPSEEQLAIDSKAVEASVLLHMAWKKVVSNLMRRLILDEDRRPDGRDAQTVRPISILPSFLPAAHGSVLFTRGETQTLAVATLGGGDMAMKQETLDGESQLRFYLQYTFPPFSVGEVGRVGAPGRREVGHGKLAERALQSVVPDKETFPYVIRAESTILESNGSSSMASVCGGCLALMDVRFVPSPTCPSSELTYTASFNGKTVHLTSILVSPVCDFFHVDQAGVPIKRMVAGVAMGLILEENRVAILTDITGMEDALGDMDFKVAGDEDGISALQMDIKVEGITTEIMAKALAQAREGRKHVLGVMREAMPTHRSTLPKTVPKVHVLPIPQKKIGDLIGPGGKQIKAVIEACGGESMVNINIAQEGLVTIMSVDEDMIQKAVTIISGIVTEVMVGQRFTGKVTKIVPFGAYIEIISGKEAWCHISELEYKRTEKVEDICKEGDMLEVEVTEVGRGGQFRVSRKPLLPAPPPRDVESSAAEGARAPADGDKRGPRRDRPRSNERRSRPAPRRGAELKAPEARKTASDSAEPETSKVSQDSENRTPTDSG